MLRTALLAVALLISGFLNAADTPAKAVMPAAPQPCSDYEKNRNYPSCDISNADKKRAKKIYETGAKLARQKKFNEALLKLKEARAISPMDAVYVAAQMAIEEKVVSEDLHRGNKALLKGDANAALSEFRQAVEISPSNEYAQQRLRDSLPMPEQFGSAKLRTDMGETRLEPPSELHSIEFKGSSIELLNQFTRLFGISTVPEQGLTPRTVRVKLDNVSWETGSQILARVCKVLFIPLGTRQVMLANDTEENRRDLTRMSLRTFYAVGGTTPQELTELTTSLRVLFDLRYITQNAAMGTIVIRAPQQTMDAITSFVDYLQDDTPTVMLNVKVFQISTDFTRDLGTSIPTQFNVFNVTSEINNLVSSSSFQQIVAALESSGQAVNATTILAALLASSGSTSSSVLSQPFGVFGGGLTLTGVTIPSSSLHLGVNSSLARTVDDVLLRAGQGKAATLKVGERFPIVSSQFSASNANTSILSSLGINTTAGTAIPSPQFSYEDIGLTLKATPQVHGKLISLDYEMAIRAIGATQVNGLPLITNRELKGTISTNEGESVVMAGLVDKTEMAAINGVPLLSLIPVLGKAFSYETKQHSADELLVVLTPYITVGRGQHGSGSYVILPTNVPK